VGDPEVEDLDAAVGGDEDVFGFEIAVDDSPAVRGRDRVRDRAYVIERLARWKRTLRQPLAKRDAFEQLGHDVRGVPVAPHVVQREDVGMRQGSDGASFALEPRQRLRVAGQIGREELDRDVAPETRVACAKYLAHAPTAERRDEFVRAEPDSGTGLHSWEL
jgi:hypothetical protein